MKITGVSYEITIQEEQRQILVLALAELALSRPALEHATILPIVDELRGREMFETFKRTSADRVKPL